MKKTVIITITAAIFLISSFSMAFAKPAKQNPGQAKKQEVQSQVQSQPNNSKVEAKASTAKAKAAAKKKQEKLPTVIKVGKLQIPTSAVIKGFKATLVWDKANNTITISKNNIVIKFVGDSKVYVNGVQVNIAKIKDGKGRLVPMGFIQKTLNGKAVTTPSAVTVPPVVTTPPAVTTSSAVTTTSAVTTSSAVN